MQVQVLPFIRQESVGQISSSVRVAGPVARGIPTGEAGIGLGTAGGSSELLMSPRNFKLAGKMG